uniref:Uncharacterized protein n=1 Tax=Anguilla anguilla TaxID=7936 RepID=A0A0E9QYK6_ANGAN
MESSAHCQNSKQFSSGKQSGVVCVTYPSVGEESFTVVLQEYGGKKGSMKK